MRVIIFSEKDLSAKFGKGKDYSIEFSTSSDINGVIDSDQALVYIDLSIWDKSERCKELKKILKKSNVRVGLLDYENEIDDPANLFHMGCVDYINRNLFDEKLKAKRYGLALSLNPFEEVQTVASENKESTIFSGHDWSNVKEGKEYLFGFLFVELDDVPNLRNTLGRSGCTQYSNDFKNFLSHYFEPWEGYLWIWNDFGGVILFPYDGKNFYALEAGMELTLNHDYVRFSSMQRNSTFRIAAHLGKTKFHSRGATGEIVSDSVNSLFHLGHHYDKKGAFHLTEDVYPFIPDSLKSFFLPAGEFEGRKIYKLKDRD